MKMKALLLACMSACLLAAQAGAAPLAAPLDARSAWQLALKLRNGDGVALDAVRARVLLTQAAQGGVAPAMFVLSNMLAAG